MVMVSIYRILGEPSRNCVCEEYHPTQETSPLLNRTGEALPVLVQ